MDSLSYDGKKPPRNAPLGAKALRLPRPRLTVRDAIALVVVAGLLLGWMADRQRQRKLLNQETYRLVNQMIAMEGAEAAFRNAGLAREKADAALAGYRKEHGLENESPAPRELTVAATQARASELSHEMAWRKERDALMRLIVELHNSWR